MVQFKSVGNIQNNIYVEISINNNLIILKYHLIDYTVIRNRL